MDNTARPGTAARPGGYAAALALADQTLRGHVDVVLQMAQTWATSAAERPTQRAHYVQLLASELFEWLTREDLAALAADLAITAAGRTDDPSPAEPAAVESSSTLDDADRHATDVAAMITKVLQGVTVRLAADSGQAARVAHHAGWTAGYEARREDERGDGAR